MEVRVGTYIKSTKNIVGEFPLPFGFRLVIFSQREGGAIAYVFGPGNGPPMDVMNAAIEIAETFAI